MNKEFISVLALFDDNSAEKIRYYRSLISTEIGKHDYLPHLTLAVYDGPIDLDELKGWVKNFCLCHKEMAITIFAVGIFNESSIFALPGISSDLHQFYKDFQKKYDDKCRDFFSLNSSKWIPHIGILYTNMHNAKMQLPILIDAFEVHSIIIKSLRITRKSSDGYVTIDEVVLSKK